MERLNHRRPESSATAEGYRPQGGDGSVMGKRGAARNNSGVPVDHSGPGLGVGPTTPATAGRKPEACPPALDLPLSSQSKSGQGSGDRVPGGGEAAVVSSLDQIQINRNKSSRRGKHCGRFTVRGKIPNSPETRFHRVNCKTWGCSYCGPRKAKRIKWAIRHTAEKLGLSRFLMTCPPSLVQG